MKRVLVTEISSPQDQQLVAYLLSQNFIVRILAESVDAGNPLLRLPVEIYPGNLSDAATIARSAKGCDYIIQTEPSKEGKNSIRDCISRLHETMNVMEAAFMAGAKTMLHISHMSITDSSNSQLKPAEMAIDLSLPMMQQMVAGTEPSAMKIILIQTDISADDNAVIDFDNYAGQVVKILRHGKHADTYTIGKAGPCETIDWSKRLQGYLHIARSKKILIAKNWNINRLAFTIGKLLGSLVWCQNII